MNIAVSLAYFLTAGLCEIGGGYLVWLWLREGKSVWLAVLGALFRCQKSFVAPIAKILDPGDMLLGRLQGQDAFRRFRREALPERLEDRREYLGFGFCTLHDGIIASVPNREKEFPCPPKQ